MKPSAWALDLAGGHSSVWALVPIAARRTRIDHGGHGHLPARR
jgi:hypothetical protein